MTAYLFALAILLIGCASTEQAKPAAEQPEPFEPPNSSECEAGEFRGFGVGANENEALSEAHSALAKQINSSVKVTSERTVNQQVWSGEENLSSNYQSRTIVEAALQNAHDARIIRKKQNGNKINVVVCMTRSDAAKGFVERLKPIAAALEFAANATIDAKHPKDKSEAWQKTKPLWGEFMPLQVMIEGLDKEKAALFEPVAALYAKAKDRYLSYCKTVMLYWQPEEDDPYSEIAFSKLSDSRNIKLIKLEKGADCEGNGIKLIYKNTGYECKYAGMFRCSHKPSLNITSCYDDKYGLLESPNVETFQKVEEVALNRLHEKLKYEPFWDDWEEKIIKQWRPLCE